MSDIAFVQRPAQMHEHLREGKMMRMIARHQRLAACLVVMPNLKEPVLDIRRKNWYLCELRRGFAQYDWQTPMLLMTCQLTPNTPLRDIEESNSRGIFAWKAYSQGATTNSEFGIAEWDCPEMHERATLSERLGVPWLLHLQDKTEDPLEGEVSALRRAMPLIERYQNLPWCIEHASCAETINYVYDLRCRGFKITATLTPHHATRCVNDVQGDPKDKVQPPFQTAKNRNAVWEATMRADLVSARDCAAHDAKLKALGWDEAPSGIWTPDEVSIPLTYQLFEEYGGTNWLTRYNQFVFGNAQRHYARFGRSLLRRDLPQIKLVREDWVVDVPTSPIQVRPFMEGEELRWRLARDAVQTA